VGQFALPSAILTQINADIGPDSNIAWVSYISTLGIAVSLPLTSRYSDIFGRRWFLILQQGLMLVGSIVGATAQNIPWLIGGQAIMSVFSGGAFSYSYLINEIVPMKYRFIGTSWGICFAVPFSGFAPAVANAFLTKPHGGWRWCYWLMTILNFVALACFYVFYHPPTFKMKHRHQTRREYLKQIDVVGIFLFCAGIVIFILGLSWGGGQYPWRSAATIAPIVLGFVTLVAFGLWEAYAPIKQPLVPMHLFRDREWVVGMLLLSFGASIYYAFAIVWPQAVVALYAEGHKNMIGILSCAAGVPYNAGQIIGGFLCKRVTRLKLQCLVSTTIGTILLGCKLSLSLPSPRHLPSNDTSPRETESLTEMIGMSTAGPDDKSKALGLLICGVFAMGWNEGVTQTLVGICVRDQKEIGIAVGIAGSSRSAISTVWSTVFVTVLTNRLATTVPNSVTPAVTEAGLPQSSVPGLLSALTSGSETALAGIQGLTPRILEIATAAFRQGQASAYHSVFYVSIAVGGSLMILSLFAPNVDHLMTDKVVVTLHRKKEESQLEQA
jgi:MFS family permease